MPVYINGYVPVQQDNILGITNTQTIALLAAGALIGVLIITGVVTAPAWITALVLGLIASYAGLYTFDNIKNSITLALNNAYDAIQQFLGGNNTLTDIVFSIIIIALMIGLAYLGYEIYENF
jgi:hypothetical protein